MKLAILQMKVREEKGKNLKKVEGLFEEKEVQQADIVLLPEMFNCPYETERFGEYAEEVPGRTTDLLSDLASSSDTYIVGGSIPEKADDKIFNTSVVFDPEGEMIGRHRKAHLFQVDYPGRIQFDEAKYLDAGDEVTTLDTEHGKMGVAICYDLRFPELFRKMTRAGSKMVMIPAAFNTTTGPAHWETLLRTRAIDNQVFVFAASPARNRSSSYKAYGHSLAVDPWGDVLVEAGEGEETLYVDVDLEKVEEIRKRLPLLESLRPEIY
ncbi:MAG: carbon-nitrogen hydrolase family protein, partial [Candidatus Bipolaricaulota bacterium]